MTRSIWKGKFIYNYILNTKFLTRQRKEIWARNSTIPSSLINKTVFVHNGKDFIKNFITREKVGFKFGDFAFTRTFRKKEEKKKTNIKKKK